MFFVCALHSQGALQKAEKECSFSPPKLLGKLATYEGFLRAFAANANRVSTAKNPRTGHMAMKVALRVHIPCCCILGPKNPYIGGLL